MDTNNLDNVPGKCGEFGSTSVVPEKKKTVFPLTNIRKRRKIDAGCKTDHDSANYLAETYFNRVQKSLSYESFEKFVKVLVDFEGKSPVERDEATLYRDVVHIFESENQSELAEEFISFIRPQVARRLGKLLQRNFLTKAWSLFNGIDSNHFGKMLNALETLTSNSNMKLSDIESSLRPLFKGQLQGNILQAICQLFGSSKPPIKDVSEFEKVTDIMENVEFENVTFPRCEVSDRSCPGPTSCTCVCHQSPDKPLCSVCNIRFINSRIYVQKRKQIRSALVEFSFGVSKDEMQKKLYPAYYAQQQTLLNSQEAKPPPPSPQKGEKKDRKNSLSESGQKTADAKSDPNTELFINGTSATNSKYSTSVKTEKGRSCASSSSSQYKHVFYEQNKEGSLEFYKQESDDENMMPERAENLSDLDFADLHPSSSEEHSSPTRHSPARNTGSPYRSRQKKTNSASKRTKK